MFPRDTEGKKATQRNGNNLNFEQSQKPTQVTYLKVLISGVKVIGVPVDTGEGMSGDCSLAGSSLYKDVAHVTS